MLQNIVGSFKLLVITILLLSLYSSSLAQNKRTNFNGLWDIYGYAMIAEIKGKDVTLHQYTSISCLVGDKIRLEQNDGSSYLYGYKLKFDSTSDDLVLSHPLGYDIYTKQLESLPTNCTQKSETTPVDNFEIFWQTFNEHYAFFDLHEVDWQNQYDTYRPQVQENTSEQELFDLFSEMLNPLKDGHIGLAAVIDGKEQEYSPGNQPSWLQNFSTIRSTLLDEYFLDEPTFFAKRRMFVGELSENIAYLNILSMMDYYNPLFWQSYNSFKDQAVLEETLDKVFAIIGDAKYDSLVIDIRFNGGGDDYFSGKIASRFADKTRSMYNKSYWYQDSFSTPQAITVNPNQDFNFNKPIILLTSGLTASAAEIFTLMMRDYPHVTVIGEATAGEFSDVIERKLPNGFGFGLSKERYLSTEGTNYEKVGIPPEEEILIDIKDFEAGNDLILDRAMEILESR